ncbi:MAG: RNA 2',3'-cyclic phosphodiesterase [Deltaproteobacteria bacterium]|nr:RNA 2',3'-cyclic phosphodiesterase [Deltaproteobacteria bacterium]
MPRLFVALRLPEPLRRELGRLRPQMPGARYEDVENLHVTLRFIGDVSDEDATFFDSALERAASVPPFTVTVEGAGVFPPNGIARVLWAGVRNEQALETLAAAIETACVEAGAIPEHRPFHAHVTLARFKPDRARTKKQVEAAIATISNRAPNAFFASSFELVESTLTPKGAIHRTRKTYELKAQDLTKIV